MQTESLTDTSFHLHWKRTCYVSDVLATASSYKAIANCSALPLTSSAILIEQTKRAFRVNFRTAFVCIYV